MPNTNAPRGFRPVGSIGAAFTGHMNEYRIASGYAANIFINDAVRLMTTGYINVAGAGVAIRGIAQGFRWQAADGTFQVGKYWPAGTLTLNGADAFVQVVDDPNVIFEARIGNATTGAQATDRGALFDLFDAGGSTALGISGQGIDIGTLATTLKQFRLLDYVQRPDNDLSVGNSAYAVGRFVAVNHEMRLQTGI